ncbi:hypothetical protein E0Z10_g7167 [Xylaria hypoxylon]|uniref:AB hydrolase-1 domain-containing protein n=1 Tax=Xylaria hypoxylon TaxID=37992 RepID=A0A4Z0YCA8_9PEZI|nr:hypothetical protein E0Z10_g7167 [Xylaria hypoxylon]
MATALNINGQHPTLNTQDSAAIGSPEPRLLLPDATSTGRRAHGERVEKPLIICFHGSGQTCSPSWDELAAKLLAGMHCRVLLYDREPGNLRPEDVAAQMWDYVSRAENPTNENESAQDEGGLNGPYLLIAHSYGALRARIRLVLVETGQEGGLDPALDELQIRSTVMGDRPVCVMKGNSFIGKWKELARKEKAMDTPEAQTGDIATRRQMLAAERELLLRVDAEDERLKRRQLGLSRNSRFVHVPDCAHHVVRDRPDEVVAAVRWVLENAQIQEEEMGAWKWTLGRIKAIFGL